jgi:cytochrome c oxidase subunit III
VARDVAHAEHFQDLERQAHAARLGMWIFLTSEMLLFAGLFALYCGYRGAYPAAFAYGVAHNTRALGSINTLVLLGSSYAVACAVLSLREGHVVRTQVLLAIAVALGGVFLAIKFYEYSEHFHEGIYPGGEGRFFVEHALKGAQTFWTLYFVTTGLHALHVTVGMGVLVAMCLRVRSGSVSPGYEHPLTIGAMYWHLVDVIWIFVWPLYYLMHGG